MTRARDISRLLGRTDNEVDSEGEIIGTTGQIVDSAYILSQAPSSTGFTFYSTLDSLPSNADAGTLAFVEANTRMYLNDGSGWYSIAAVNLSPSLTLSPSGAIELATDGSASTITITATDTDDPSAILSYSVESDGNMKATGTTVTQDSSVFTITPITQASGGVAGNFTLSFKVSDQIDEAVANKDFSLTFQSTGTLVRNASYINEGGSVTFTLPVSGYSDGDTIPYSITGISASDINEGLTGNMVVNGAGAYKTITATADFTTEGTEYMTFSADNQSVNVQIADTSISNHVDWQTNPGLFYHSGVITGPNQSYTHGSSLSGNYSGLDYGTVGGRPKTIAVATISWRDTGTFGNDLNANYGFRMQNGSYWTVYQDTSNAQTNMSAFAVAPASYLGGVVPKIVWANGAPDKMAFSVTTFYSDNGIDLSTIKFERYRGTNGSTSLGNGTIRSNWSNHEVVVVATNTPGTAPNSYGVNNGYGIYAASPNSRNYWNSANGTEGVYWHGYRDLANAYLPSTGISHNLYPYSPDIYYLLLQKT